MAAFANKCPKCRTAIKIRSRDMDGKKARCPRCSTVFRIKAPPQAKAKTAKRPPSEEFSFLGKITDEDLTDYGPLDESSDELDEFDEDDESLEARSTRQSGRSGSSKSKRKRKEKKPINSDLLIGGIVIGLGLLLFVGVGIVGSMMLPDLLGQNSRMAWMPDDLESFVEIEPEQLWMARALRPLREERFGVQLREHLDELVNPLKISELDHIAIGFPANSSENPEPVVVFYALSSFDVPALKSQADGFTETTHAEQTYYFQDASQRAVFFPQSDVLVYGTEEHIKAAIDSEGVCAAEKDFDLPARQTIVYVAKNLRDIGSFGAGNMVGPNLLPADGGDGLQGISLVIDVGSNMDIEAVFRYDSTDKASKLVTKANEQITETVKQMRYDRDERSKTDPAFKLNMLGLKAMVTAQIELLESLDISQSGSNVDVALRLPTTVVENSVGMLALMGASLLPAEGFMPDLSDDFEFGVEGEGMIDGDELADGEVLDELATDDDSVPKAEPEETE